MNHDHYGTIHCTGKVYRYIYWMAANVWIDEAGALCLLVLNQGCTSSLEVNPYLSQVEELKQKLIAAEEKLASPEDRICVYDEQIQELKKMLAKKEAHCRGYAIGVEELQKKIAKQYMKTSIPRKRGKVLRNIVVFFWGLLCVVIVAFAIK
ncbi:hypothetical protein HKD37_09G025440 [Glycine soja]